MGLALNGEYEPVETKLILELVKPGAAILDIGANIGYYSLLFAKLTGPSGQVFAFEPDPYSYDLLQQNILENGYTNIFAFQLGVSDQNEELVLYRDPFNNLDHRVLMISCRNTQPDQSILSKWISRDQKVGHWKV